MANRHRGDVDLLLGDERLTLRLTLNALAELESAFAVADLSALGSRFQSGRLSARDLIAMLGAAVRGGGASLTDAEIATSVTASDLPAATDAIARLFAATFGEAPNPPVPQGA